MVWRRLPHGLDQSSETVQQGGPVEKTRVVVRYEDVKVRPEIALYVL